MTSKPLAFLIPLLCGSLLAAAQTTPPPPPHNPNPENVADIPVNYDESKAGNYVLPDPLKLNNGKPVLDSKTWLTKRRPEIVSMLETQQFGSDPGRPADESFEVTDKASPALDGHAIRRQVTISFSKNKDWPQIHLLMYLPAAAKKPVPMLLDINFVSPANTVDDPGIQPGMIWDPKTNTRIPAPPGHRFAAIDPKPLLEAGIGFATFYYGDLEPDYAEGFSNGIRARYLKPGQTQPGPDEWGAIAAWAWGMSRVQDYFETDSGVDAKRVAIFGISRLGKTVMWAGAHDERFAAVIASCSGEGGAALSRRVFGETVAHLVAPSRFPYQFAANYQKYGQHLDQMPMDAHMLVALVAPRPLLLQTGTTDLWSDPKGEFLSAVAAGPVYNLLGKDPLDTTIWPAAKQPILHDLAYYMHDGGHGTVPSDWNIFLDFLKANLHPER